MSISEAEKKKIVLSILNVFAKTGATARQIFETYKNETGEDLVPAPPLENMRAFMETFDQVDYDANTHRYTACSDKSKHIAKFVAQQRDSFSYSAFNNRISNSNNFNNNLNRSLSNRQPVSYKNDYIDVPKTPVVARKIQNRRMTYGAPLLTRRSSSPESEKRHRSLTPDQNNSAKRFRGRSRSRRRQEDRSPSSSRYRRHSPERRRNRDSSSSSSSRKSDRDRSLQRRNRSRSRPRGSISPRRSPLRRRRTSPSRRSRSPRRSRSRAVSRSPPKDRPEATISNPHRNGIPPTQQTDTQLDNQSSAQAVISNTLSSMVDKKKKFKFTIIGDGYIYYMYHEMQSQAQSELPLCHHTLTIADALNMVENHKEQLQGKKRKVLISIGATDLRSDTPLYDLKRDFTKLFILCNDLKLKPLITTVLCFDNPIVKEKSEIFNEFLLENFHNVIDMREVVRFGMADVMINLNNKDKVRRNKLEPGTHQQLVLLCD